MIIPGIVASIANSGPAEVFENRLTYTSNSMDVSVEVSFPNSLAYNLDNPSFLYIFSSSSSGQVYLAQSSLASATLMTPNWAHTSFFSTLRGTVAGRRTADQVTTAAVIIGADNQQDIRAVDRNRDFGVTSTPTAHAQISVASIAISMDTNVTNSKLLALGVDDTIREYTPVTPWNTDSAFTQTDSLDISSNVSNPVGICCNPAGTRMWVADAQGGVSEYTMSTDRDLSTASFEAGVKSQPSEFSATIADIAYRPSATGILILTIGPDATLYEYDWAIP